MRKFGQAPPAVWSSPVLSVEALVRHLYGMVPGKRHQVLPPAHSIVRHHLVEMDKAGAKYVGRYALNRQRFLAEIGGSRD